MKQLLSFVVVVSFLQFGAPVAAEQIAWDDLVDKEAQLFEDPYLDLEYDQLDDLRTIAVETARLENSGLAGDDRAASLAKRDEARARLTAAGIDADWLIDQRWVVAERREKAATSANPEIDGKTVTLGGFAIAAPPDADGTRIVYLVPERGMCSHMPPPNPNQMIRARLKGDWSPQMVHEPVRMTGILISEQTQHTFRIVDGDVPMRASFVMQVDQVETMDDLYSEAQPTNEWAEGIAARLRASGQLPKKQGDIKE